MQLEYTFNAWICMTLGGTLNILLFYWINKRSTSGLRKYKVILQQTCVFDINWLIVTVILQPVSKHILQILFFKSSKTDFFKTKFFFSKLYVQDGSAVFIFFTSILPTIPLPWRFICLMWYQAAFFSNLYGMTIQFIYRYLILCKYQHLKFLLKFWIHFKRC